MAEPTYEVVWPLGRSVYETVPVTPAAADLSGKTVCEIWDWLFKGNEMFPVIREELSKRYPGVKFVDYSVFGDTHGPREPEVIAAMPDLLRKHGCDVVISGVGA
ncbi:MAG: hypothetical protein HYX92_18120 [Chloroflexi bacterium]|nr:hypothetical protein [Chloroflexota bacterium]